MWKRRRNFESSRPVEHAADRDVPGRPALRAVTLTLLITAHSLFSPHPHILVAMKLMAAISATVLLVGCGEKSSPTRASNTNATTGNPVTAPVDYLSAIAKGQQSAVKTVDSTSLNKAIQLFNVDHGRNPKDLNELVQEKYIPQLPAAPFGMQLSYDPNSGEVKVVKKEQP